MKAEQLKPIVSILTERLTAVLANLEPALKNDYWVKNPNIKGICWLIEKALPTINQAGESELKLIYETLKAAKDTFWLQMNDSTIATCFVLVSPPEKAKQIEIEQFFWKQITPNFLKSVRTSAKPFNYFFVGGNVSGFTPNTYYKLLGKRQARGISVFEQTKPLPGETILLENNRNRDLLLNQIEPFSQHKNVLGVREKIHEKFEIFCTEVEAENVILAEQFTRLESILSHEIENRNQAQTGQYLHLKFGIAKNQQIINFLYQELSNNNFFHTSKSNFESVFTPKKTIPIQWEKGLNAFLKLFFGFENLEIDGFARSFEGLLSQRKDLILAISESFEFNVKTTKPIHNYISGKITTIKNTRPNEMPVLWPIIEQIKKMV